MTTVLERIPPRAPLSADAAPCVDDPDAQAAFTSWSDDDSGRRIAVSHLQLTGLWCAGCATVIEQALAAEPGVLDARVSYGSERATVRWDPQRTRVSGLLEAIGRVGYGAVPDVAASARALRRGEERRMLWRLVVAVFCMMQVMMYQAPLYVAGPGTLTPDLRTLLLWAAFLLSVPVVVFAAAPFFRDAWAGLRQRRIGMDLPVALGIGLAFVASTGATFDPDGIFGADAYFDSLTMFVSFLLAGRFLNVRRRHRAGATLVAAVPRLPVAVRRLEADGRTTLVAPQRLRRGDCVQVLAGEAFPADGRLVAGRTEVDEALLTGESRPVAKQAGDKAIAGSINLRGAVVQQVERLGADTRYEGIVALMRDTLADRPALRRSADRIAGPVLWAVLVWAAAAAAGWSMIDPGRALPVAVAVLIVTCPCALSLAAPSALLAAAGAMARRGVLVRRLDAIEALAGIDSVCFDKTGTLTDARLALASIELQAAATRNALDDATVLARAASLARMSTHPLAASLAEAAPLAAMPTDWRDVHEMPGQGIEAAAASGGRSRLGSLAWVGGADPRTMAPAGPEAWFGDADGVLARFVFAEGLRADAAASVAALRTAGLGLHMLSGDRADRVRAVAARLGIEQAQGDASPADKRDAVARLQAAGHRVAMVGDGINDAPVMARADVSFAVGQGTALTRARADIALLSGSLDDVVWAHGVARRALAIVRQNLAASLAYNLVCVPLAMLGAFPPWAAGLGMAASSLVVVVNSLRVDPAARPTFSGAARP